MEWIPPVSYLCRSPVFLSPTQEEKCLSPRWQAHFLSLAALKMPSKAQTVKKAEWREPGGLFQGSFNSSLTRKSLWCAARFCSLWLWAGVTSKWGERGGMRVRSMWLRNESPKKWVFPPPPLHSTGTLLQQQLFKVLWYFSPLMFIFLFLYSNIES